jgi:methyl-accepting chemotaxis protein
VAAAVRLRAQRSAEAARDIGGLVSESALSVGEGLRRVSLAGDALGGIRAAMARLDAMIGDVASAGREQAAGVGEISAAVAQMDRLTQENAGLTDGLARDAGLLAAQIDGLADRAAVFATRARRADARAA